MTKLTELIAHEIYFPHCDDYAAAMRWSASDAYAK